MMEREGEEELYRISLTDTVILFDTLVQGIELPQVVVGAINRKTEQYYISEEYKFRVAREKRESERKKIEAEGVRDFQQIVSQGISDSYLRWRGIEATLQLAQSNNSKVVIIGSAKDGLPIILGNLDTPPSSGAGQTSPKDGWRSGQGDDCGSKPSSTNGEDTPCGNNGKTTDGWFWHARSGNSGPATLVMASELVRYRNFLGTNGPFNRAEVSTTGLNTAIRQFARCRHVGGSRPLIAALCCVTRPAHAQQLTRPPPRSSHRTCAPRC